MFIRKHQLDWVVDMDLSKCFDLLDHELIISSVKRKVTDGSILKLLNQFLKSGVMIGNNWEASTVGSRKVASLALCWRTSTSMLLIRK